MTFVLKTSLNAGLLLLLVASSVECRVVAADRDAALPTDVQRVLKTYCYECHDQASAQGKLAIDTLPVDFSQSSWVRIHDRLAKNEMPPKGSPQPTPAERTLATAALRQRLHDSSLAKQRTEGRVVVRRLNRTEYETTLRDLLGKQVTVRDLLPEDNSAAGFDNVAAALEVSSVHLLRYQDAAQRALATVVPRAQPTPIKQRRTAKEVVEKSKQFSQTVGKSSLIVGDEAILYAYPYSHVVFGTPPVAEPGRYRVRASMYAVGTAGRPLPVRWTIGMEWGKDDKHAHSVHDVPADQPTVIEEEIDLAKRNAVVDFFGWSLPSQRRFEAQKNTSLEEYTGPGLRVQWVEIEGPLDPFPPTSYKRLFGDLPLKSPYARGDLKVESEKPREDAERLMRSFLPIAFRRPVGDDLVDYYVGIVQGALDKKTTFEEAMLLGYRAALCSPHFLYLAEPLGREPADQPGRLDAYALAARLSYFLWSTAPDRELLQLANSSELSQDRVLRQQVERLLNDPRAARFTENFAGQWLELRNVDATTPDPQAYGEFDPFLFWSMPRETKLFFEEILRHDRSLVEFVHSDWTYLNERLAKHYGIPGVFGGELRRTQLPADSHRGGVLTQASILKVTADGTKTSPVLRGKWVLDRIVGQPTPPPPANVSAIEPDIRGATTIRQQLDKHRNTEACATCHRHIDPPGFALESFDVIGGWREFYRGTVNKRGALVDLANYPGRQIIRGLDVEKGGQMPDGRPFQNVDEYKQLLLADQDQLARNVAEKLVIYATGADLQFADREVIEGLVAKSRQKNYGFRSLLHDVVQSRLFRNK